MGRYVIRRVLQGLLTLFGTLFIVHYLMSLAIQIRGNPAATFFSEKSRPSERQLQIVAEMFGTDDPCFEQVGNPCVTIFAERMGRLAQWDLGTDYKMRSVNDLLAQALPNTLTIFAITIIVWMIFGIGLGVLAALYRDRFIDHSIRVLTVLMTAFPTFLVALLLQQLIGISLGNWLKGIFGADSVIAMIVRPTFNQDEPWLSGLLPGMILGMLGVAALARLMRTSLLENLGSDFVRTARAKGLAPRRVLVVHAIRNSLIPVVTVVGGSFGAAIGGAVITETIFNIRGVGLLMINATRTSDMSIVISIVTLSVILIITVNLIVDLLYATLDPRIRYE
ncbi:ABC transporter permease [Stackebrandtia soli]|uniref:ABC transporter permease n=1 Tax=Stackebrandtia soli TaxID=1892856 RepID=UPI0039EA975A